MKTSEDLWQYYVDKPNDTLINSKSFKSKVKITRKVPDDGNRKDVEIAVPLKYLRNFYLTLDMPLTNREISLNVTWPSTCVITDSTGARAFAITDAKLYVPAVILSTQVNAKLLQQLKPGFKRTINWNKYLSKNQ